MTEPQLWALHVEGPDDVVACADRAEADVKATEINEGYEAFRRRPEASDDDPRWHANVVPWEWGAAQHAEEVARGDERWEP